MDENKENCISPEFPYCPACKYGSVIYPSWVETYEDTYGCTCEWVCRYKEERNKEVSASYENTEKM